MAACLAWEQHEIPLERCQQFRINGRVLFPLFSGQLPACEASGTHLSGNRIAIVFPWVQARTNNDARHKVALNAGLWLQSAAANADIADFLIIHDFEGRATIDTVLSASQTRLPSNIRRMEVASVPQLYQERANLSVPPAAHFIARLKPCIGHVFASQLVGYSHWAYGDFDVAYGSLQRFLTPDLLRRHAIVTLRDEVLCSSAAMSWFAGQLTVFRNEEWVNQLFRAPMRIRNRVYDWKAVAFHSSAVADHYDERGPYPTAAAEAAKSRGVPVAYVASQLNDLAGLHFMLGEACGQPGNACGRLVWIDGRLLQIDNVQKDPMTGAAVLGDACIRTEAAFVHLGRIKFTDGRMCKIDPPGCGRRPSKKLGSWMWNFSTAGKGVEIRTPYQHQQQRSRGHFGFVSHVGLRELEPWLADAISHAAPNCSSFDMKHPAEMPNEYIRGREWARNYAINGGRNATPHTSRSASTGPKHGGAGADASATL